MPFCEGAELTGSFKAGVNGLLEYREHYPMATPVTAILVTYSASSLAKTAVQVEHRVDQLVRAAAKHVAGGQARPLADAIAFGGDLFVGVAAPIDRHANCGARVHDPGGAAS